METINAGCIHIVEPDLDEFVKAAVDSGRLKASTTPSQADIFIIAVPTPFMGNHVPDLRFIKNAVEAISRVVKKGKPCHS